MVLPAFYSVTLGFSWSCLKVQNFPYLQVALTNERSPAQDEFLLKFSAQQRHTNPSEFCGSPLHISSLEIKTSSRMLRFHFAKSDGQRKMQALSRFSVNFSPFPKGSAS